MTASHPAKFSLEVLNKIGAILREHQLTRILDPFAGVGRVHWLPTFALTVGVEIEPEWAEADPNTIVGNALTLPFPDATFDCMVTSPAYGNRMADHHHARDTSTRNTYRHQLGRPLHPHNTGALQWGPDYRRFHRIAWREAHRVLTDRALIILNLSNHIRKSQEQLVAEWHLSWWLGSDCKLLDTIPIQTPRQRQGSNRHLRVNHEWVFVLEKFKEGY